MEYKSDYDLQCVKNTLKELEDTPNLNILMIIIKNQENNRDDAKSGILHVVFVTSVNSNKYTVCYSNIMIDYQLNSNKHE